MRYSHGAAVAGGLGGARRLLVTHGYNKQHGPEFLDDTWARTLPDGDWEAVDVGPERPAARLGHALVALSASELLLFGGDDGGGASAVQSYKAGSYLDDAWVLRLRRGATAGAWHKGLPSPCRPSARSLHTMNAVHSPAEPTALAVLFGGRVRSATDGQTGGWALSDSSELWVGSVTAAQEGGVTVAWSPARPESGDDACSLQPGAGDCRPRVLLEDSGAEAGLPQWPEARHGHASALSRAARDGNGTGEQPDCPGVAAGACASPFAGGAWLFGGEAYMPSRYFDDLWRLAPARRGAADALVDALLAAVVSSVVSVGFTAAWVPGSAWITLGGFAAAPS
ncbi:hypothetical protein FNF29_05856 [Cafeteria roenbergensis]|uniref:Uncharacterized protein n=1 Tax=Cafeteria roenbergensis TaxID=33653 RepID=A0A5A8CAY7_CAFRO|nr:hypothetical protein FNF29_05856 [Cafeteria roenbergensis]|eukprot:KAA0149644.1 hypothetical protein FNF29_05856 [Cafeteria roenbergensis]